ncbi:hypothetical protein QN277_008748 [Acacia crassicarpa]|nr:hypothetical protein QN277_008748 [Acacia crassicarpa]
MLEVVCGRRPVDLVSEDMVLVDWVYGLWKKGEIIEAKDQNLGTEYKAELELVLKLGLLCSNSKAGDRPSMRQVVQYLNMEVPLPDFSTLISSPSCSGFVFGRHQDLDDIAMSLPSSSVDGFHSRYSIPESILSGGR